MIATITTASTSGPSVEAMLNCGFCASLGSLGSSSRGGAGARSSRGGRLNSTVPPAPRCRRRSSPCGRSSSVGTRIATASAPSSITLPGASARSVVPSTSVPLAESRSVSVPCPSASSSSAQWRRETEASASTTVLPASRPSVERPAGSGKTRPASRPDRTTSSSGHCREPPGRRSSGTGASVAPSCRPTSTTRHHAGTTRSSIATDAGTSVPSTACRSSPSVASGLRRATSTSRSPAVVWTTIRISRAAGSAWSRRSATRRR